ncbi:MAG: MFS transporter [Actinobacteria bacterium]|jgi:dTMP kinase|nr:MAG: MFS transporter [Actinomycetota bacterium]
MEDTKSTETAECAEPTPKGFQRTEDNLQIKPAAYRDLLRNHDFLLLWAGQMVSSIGDWIIVAILLGFVNKLAEGQSWAISVMMLVKFLPAVLLGFMAGIVIDRVDRKRTLIVCDLCRAGLVILFAFSNSLLMILILVFIIETFSIIYGPAKDASIPDLVAPEQLANANSLNQLTIFAAMAFGTAIAGSVTGLFAWLGDINSFIGEHVDPNRAAFFVDSLTFIVSAFLIFKISGFRRLSEEERVKMSSAQVKQDFKEGLRYLLDQRLTRTILILTLACFLGGGTIYVLTIGFVTYVLGKGDATFYYILSVLLFGIMAGSILGGVLKTYVKKERVMGLAISGFGAGVIVFSLVSIVWLSFIVAFFGGVCMGYAIVGMITLLMETLAEEYRGRAFAAIQVIMRASIFLSIMLAGPLADLITAIGRSIGLSPINLGIIRLGGSFEGSIDGDVVSFRYLFNGPQMILFIGGIIILLAGVYGQRSFHRYFGWNIHDKIFQRKQAVAETMWEPAMEGSEIDACADETTGARETAAARVEEEMEYLSEAEQAFKKEITGEAAFHEDERDPGVEGRGGGGAPDGEE